MNGGGGLEQATDVLLTRDMPIEDKLGVIAAYFLDQYELRPDLVHLFITEFFPFHAQFDPGASSTALRG